MNLQMQLFWFVSLLLQLFANNVAEPVAPRVPRADPLPPRADPLPPRADTISVAAEVPALRVEIAPETTSSPYSCKMDHSLFRLSRLGNTFPADETNITIGVLGSAPAIVTLLGSGYHSRAGYQVTLSDRFRMRLDKLVEDATMPLASLPVPRGLLSSEEVRYFWLRAAPAAAPAAEGSGEVAFGRQGQTTALLRAVDPFFVKPSLLYFRGNPYWIHSCDRTPTTPSLGCRKMFTSRRFEFGRPFAIEDEAESLPGNTKAVRFMVRAMREAYVRLGGETTAAGEQNITFIEINLKNVLNNKITLQKGSSVQTSSSLCNGCLSPSEFRLFTVVFNDTTVALFEGYNMTSPRVSTNLASFKIRDISFASFASAPQTFWLHACQGDAVAVRLAMPGAPPGPALGPVGPYHLRPFAANSSEALEAVEAATRGCRMVHTFKYKFDVFFSISEDGTLTGTTSRLPFRVLGRKDFHIQLVSRMPPLQNETYEVDLDFNNRTNIDRGGTTRVASLQHTNRFSAHELRGFVLMHDRVTGVLEVLTADNESVIAWRDPQPFPLRYFSVSSGSSAGNDTTWVFGCPADSPTQREKGRLESGCSLPLLTHSYSHAQYFSVSREGEVNGTRRTINLFVRAHGSGHIRLEHVLPPQLNVEALFEVDLSHENYTSIDSHGKRMATTLTPNLLSVGEMRGFWIRQDLGTRRLEVGAYGQTEPLLSWTAPPLASFPEARYFSLATSRSVSNGTWVYGCKANRKPVEEAVPDVAEGEDRDPEFVWEDLVTEQSVDEAVPAVPTTTTRTPPPPQRPSAGNEPPPPDTSFGVHLNLSRIYLDDISGMVVLRGHLRVAWRDNSWSWPSHFERILENSGDSGENSGVWVPEFTVKHGDMELGGELDLHLNGSKRFEAPLLAGARCRMQARGWPRDQHRCELELTLTIEDQNNSLYLLGAQPLAEAAMAAEPLWELISLAVRVRPEAYNTLSVTVELRRATPVLQHLLLAPFVVLAALSLLAYWVPEPLPRDKVWLGCASLLLVVLTFLVLEQACPPGLTGVPVIIQLYCGCVCIVALSVVVTAITTALARDNPSRNPPPVVCHFLSNPILRWLLLLSDNQIDLRRRKAALNPDAVGYSKGSSRVYVQFENDAAALCKCNDKNCSRQVAFEAQHYWTLLAMACERIFSILCFVMLLVAAILVQ